jgi:conjugal transfer ATP-binding protein TraC
MDSNLLIKKYSNKFKEFLFSGVKNGTNPTTREMANSFLERNSLNDLLPYRDWDDSTGLVFTDNGRHPSAGFSFAISPHLISGKDTEDQFDAFLGKLPADSVVQTNVFSSPGVSYYLDRWAESRIANAPSELLKELATQRKEYFKKAATDFSLLSKERLHPRICKYGIFVNIPFKGDYTSTKELEMWMKMIIELRDTLKGTLQVMQFGPRNMEKRELRSMLRALLNPQYKETHLDKIDKANGRFGDGLVDKGGRVFTTETGDLAFTKAGDNSEKCVACLTVDSYPESLRLFQMAGLIGAPKDLNERIAMPFFMYTNIHILDKEKAKDDLNITQGILNKQTMSDSQWYKSMMSSLFDRARDNANLIKVAEKGKSLVKMYTGINIYTNQESAKLDAEYVAGIWRNNGFNISRESYITLPIFINSLPFCYDPANDNKKTGLQRSITCHSLNAACAVTVQGDWIGTDPARGGPLFVTRRGTLASLDVFSSPTNYNFVTIATSGAGKSYFNQELVTDLLSRGALVRVFDVGGSYRRLCQQLGGEELLFDPDNPKSLNCFWDMKDEIELKRSLPFLKEIFRLMAYPVNEIPAWERQALENCIVGAWQKHRNKLETHHLHAWFLEQAEEKNDSRFRDLAFMIEPHALGRYKEWFNGPRELKFSKQFTIIELENLTNDPELKTLVLTLAANEIANEFYLTGRTVMKATIIDEGWDLLKNKHTEDFIERLFRTARKYKACVGLITQSYNDFIVNPAAKSALENSAWRFNLYQLPDSFKAAKETNRIPDDPFFYDLITSLKPSSNGYSEVFVDSQMGRSIFRFTVDPHTHWTYTTNPSDLTKLEELKDKGYGPQESIDILANQSLHERGIKT